LQLEICRLGLPVEQVDDGLRHLKPGRFFVVGGADHCGRRIKYGNFRRDVERVVQFIDQAFGIGGGVVNGQDIHRPAIDIAIGPVFLFEHLNSFLFHYSVCFFAGRDLL
jgi:hypothetical protein